MLVFLLRYVAPLVPSKYDRIKSFKGEINIKKIINTIFKTRQLEIFQEGQLLKLNNVLRNGY